MNDAYPSVRTRCAASCLRQAEFRAEPAGIDQLGARCWTVAVGRPVELPFVHMAAAPEGVPNGTGQPRSVRTAGAYGVIVED